MLNKRLISYTIGLLIVLLIVFMFTVSSFAAMVSGMKPYLMGATSSSVYVLVECDSTAAVTVEYGTTASYGLTETDENYQATDSSTYVHNVKLTGLSANTTYHYRASQGGTPSADSTFKTAPDPGTGFRFCFAADSRTGTSYHDTIASRILAANPAMSLYGGDLCATSSYGTWKNEFFRTNELNLISKVPFYNGPGNHEAWGTNTKAFTQGVSGDGVGNNGYYSFDYGDMHVAVLNHQSVGYASGSAQWNFVASDLAATDKTWKIVMGHEPAYCSGGHGENSTMKSMSSSLFVPNGVQFYLGGHTHFYQHNLVSGIHHIVSGGMGATLATPSTASYTQTSLKDYNYCIIDVTSSSFDFNAYTDEGTFIENIHLGGAGGPTPTPTPVGPTNTPTPTSTPTPTTDPSSWLSKAAWTEIHNLGSSNTGTVTIEYDVTPLANNIDGTTNYADTSTTITTYASCAMAVRMWTTGNFDVRNGGSYTALTNVPYSANNTYHVKIVANMTAATYDVWVTPPGGSETMIADNYAFRSDAPATNDVGQVCLKSTNDSDFRINNHTVSTGTGPTNTPTPTPTPTNTPTPAGPTNTPTNTPTPTPTPTPGGGGGTFNLNPAADSYVHGASADINFGTAATLDVKNGSGTTNDRIIYLKFDLNGATGSSVSSAKLKLYCNNLGNGTPTYSTAYGVTTDTWTETGITWNNMPAIGSSISSQVTLNNINTWYEFDVTSYISGQFTGDKTASIAIQEATQASKIARYDSKEATNVPVLTVVTQ